MKNKFTGIIGSAIGCVVSMIIVNVVAHGAVVVTDLALLGRMTIISAVIGAIVGVIVSAVGSRRPLLAGTVTTIAVYAVLLTGFGFLMGSVVDSVATLIAVVATVLFIGFSTGLGYSILGPKTE